ncbi:MAG: hypothetical protein RBQ71_02290 [Acholeplasmataceae bacterium]|jgi:uncharacterized tellurite resistance protein B-like protein|nr:hypothetical protein [Acholeplasmataceae bacterium]
MGVENLMHKIVEKIQKNNYYWIKSDKALDITEAEEKGYVEVTKDGFIRLTEKFISDYEADLTGRGFTFYQIQSLNKHFLYPIYFNNELLAQYINNPNYFFRWNHYRGTIVSHDDGVDIAYLKNICLAHNLKEKKPVIAMFLGDVVKLDKNHQSYIERFEIIEKHHLEMHEEVIKNLIHGERSSYDSTDIYNLIVIGRRIINDLYQNKYSYIFFNTVMETTEYEYFHPIFISTKLNYYLFVLEVYKILYDNINKSNLKKILKQRDGLSTEDITRLSMFDLVSRVVGFDSTIYLKKINDTRNIPAHEIFTNELDANYWEKQDDILIDTYRFINSIIASLNDPLPEPYKEYQNVFGREGRVLTGNGFNQPPYSYYDGQIRLICEAFQERDAEFLIAFKSLESIKSKLSEYISLKRPDLKSESIKHAVEMIFSIDYKPTKKMVFSFFKGYEYIKQFYSGHTESRYEYIHKGDILAKDFLSRYPIENIFVVADSTDPYYSDFDQCLSEDNLIGKGYITELFHFFKEEYQYDNVVTKPNDDLDIQIVSNIWD